MHRLKKRVLVVVHVGEKELAPSVQRIDRDRPLADCRGTVHSRKPERQFGKELRHDIVARGCGIHDTHPVLQPVPEQEKQRDAVWIERVQRIHVCQVAEQVQLQSPDWKCAYRRNVRTGRA